MPDGHVSMRDTTYDLTTGAKHSVSEAGVDGPSSHLSVFGPYDPFGRPLQIIAPDQSTTTFDYHHGVHTVDKTVGIGRQQQGDTVVSVPTTTTELYDPFGRLASVSESGASTDY